MHEITHVMVFSPNLYKYYIDWTKGNRRGENNVVGHVNANSHIWEVIKTPRVQSFVRSNFNCNSLEGAPLEDKGPAGKSAHWEKEFFGNEYMTSATVINPVISDLSWALFVDSGWYQFRENAILPNGNELKTETLTWSIDKGCDVYDKQCPNNGVQCSTIGEAGCSFDTTFQASCQTVSNADTCKWYQPTNFWTQDCRVNTNQSTYQLYGLQSFGVNRRCFTGKYYNYGKSSLCYLPKCTKDGNNWKLEIQLGGQGWTKCNTNGQTIPA